MLEQQDVQKLMDVLATKDDIRRLEDRISNLEENQNKVITILDKISLRIDVIHQEYLGYERA